MPSRRIQRLNELLKREISRVLRREVRDPRVGVVTVTGVDTTADLAFARVYVRPVGDEPERAEAMEGLEAAAPHVRHQLAQVLTIRQVPELRFEQDETLERAMRIEKILRKVRPDGGWEEPLPEGADPVEVARRERAEQGEDAEPDDPDEPEDSDDPGGPDEPDEAEDPDGVGP